MGGKKKTGGEVVVVWSTLYVAEEREKEGIFIATK